MRAFILSALLLGSTTAFAAVDKDSSWDAIFAERGIQVDDPSIWFDNHQISVFDTCVNGDYLETTETVRECSKWERRNKDNDRCVEWSDNYLTTPRTYTKTVCERWGGSKNEECRKEKTVTVVIPLTYSVSVYKKTGHGKDRDGRRFLFSKEFEIPACN